MPWNPLPRRLAALTVLAALTGALWLAPDAAADPVQSARRWGLVDVWAASYDESSLLDPGGMSAVGDELYVADTGHHRVAVLDASGAVVRTLGGEGHGPGALHRPTDVAVDATRARAYVVDRGNRRIAVFDPQGTDLGGWSKAGPDFALVPKSVAVDEATGQVLVLSASIVPRVERFDANGQWLGGWGRLGLGTGQFVQPTDVAVAPGGLVLVTDSGSGRVQVFGLGGDSRTQWSGLLGARAIDVDPSSGDSWVLGGGSADRAVRVDGDGRIRQTVHSRSLVSDAQFRPGGGIAVWRDTVAVSTGFGGARGQHGVRVFDPGTFDLAAAYTKDPREHDGFVEPAALAAGDDGTVHVLDGAVRVVRWYSPAGEPLGRAESGVADEITLAPDGSTFVADVHQFVALRRLNPAGGWVWDKSCDCLSGMGLAAGPTHVYATDALSGTVQVFDLDPDEQEPIAAIPLTDAPYVWPVDTALTPDGELLALDSVGTRLHVLDVNTRTVARSLSLPGHGDRLSVAPDGTIFVLLLDGSVVALDMSGQVEHRWTPRVPGRDGPRPRDIAAGPDGRLYVLDDATHGVWLFDPGASPVPTPDPGPAPCNSTGDKTASPTLVGVGDPVTVTLTLDIACQGETGADIMLVLDRSSSMSGEGCSKLCEAQRAAHSFVAGLDLSRHRVGVLGFSDTATLELALTADRNAIDAAIDDVLPAGNTDIAAAVAHARDHAAAARRPEALVVHLVLTDGDPSGTEQAFVDAVREGIRARDHGAVVYTIGLGANVNRELLTEIAGSPERYFFAPSAADLQPIYDRLGETLGEIVATNLVIEDRMGARVDYEPGSATGSPRVDGDLLTWDVGAAPESGVRLSYVVRPRAVGRLPTNTRAEATFEVAGSRLGFVFPVPQIEVVALPTATATATATPTPTPVPPTATRRPGEPDAAYLPLVMAGVCLPKDRLRGADIMLVMDTSSSMSGPKLAAAIEAAQAFVDTVDPRRDRIGVVAFAGGARRVYILSADLPRVRDALGTLTTGEGTRIDLGLREGIRQMGLWGRPDSEKLIILLSDGLPTGGYEEAALRAAHEARSRAYEVYAIGLGADADPAFLRAIASRPANYLFAPSPEDLRGAYRRVADRLPCR